MRRAAMADDQDSLLAAIRYNPANLKILSLADHRAAHRLLAQEERALATAFVDIGGSGGAGIRQILEVAVRRAFGR